MSHTRKSSGSEPAHRGQNQFQHWYRDHQVYFITARCHHQFPAFASDQAKTIFWNQFDKYAPKHGFTPWVTSLLNNHYHTVGYIEQGEQLPRFMHHLHGSVAKLVNDLLESQAPIPLKAGGINSPCPQRRKLPFWHDSKHRTYFDGCLRNEKQGRLTYAYVLRQSERHGLCTDHRTYPHTRVHIDIESAIAHAQRMNAFLEGVPYKRYLKSKPHSS